MPRLPKSVRMMVRRRSHLLAVSMGRLLWCCLSLRRNWSALEPRWDSERGGEFSAGGVVVGCVLGSEVDCCPEHATNVSAAREEKVSAVRRLTDLVLYFIRISHV